jgi:hypothetical protein
LKEIYSEDVVIITLRTIYLTVGHTCDLNILDTRMEASVHLFQNRGMTLPHRRILDEARIHECTHIQAEFKRTDN